MVATKVDTVYVVALPGDVRAILRSLGSIFTFGVQGFATTPLACLGLGGYENELRFWMALPPVVVLLVVAVVTISTKLQAVRSRPGASSPARETTRAVRNRNTVGARHNVTRPGEGASLVEKCAPAVLRIMFLLYPLVTNAAFEGFPCYEFEGGRGWLIADVTIECRTPQHDRARLLAWAAVFLYPVGMWLGCLLLLVRSSKAIMSGVETPLSRACSFLYREYDPSIFWWELMDMARKFLLVGLFVWAPAPGSITQLATGTIVCAVFLMVQLQAKPFQHYTDDYLATASSFGLLMLFICSIFFKYEALTATDDVRDKMSTEQRVRLPSHWVPSHPHSL